MSLSLSPGARKKPETGAHFVLTAMFSPHTAALSSPRVTDYADMSYEDEPLVGSLSSSAADTPDQDHRTRFLSDTKRSIDRIVKQLSTDSERGLTAAQCAQRLADYGPNALEEEPRTPLAILFLLQFYNLIITILLVAAIASFGLGKNVEATAILFIVTLNAIVAIWQEQRAGNALAQMASPQCVALRDGEQQVIDSKVLVRGDIVVLVTGDVVPADIRLIVSSDLKVNEMLFTGESEDVSKRFNADVALSKKLTADNMVFSSTTVTAGNACGIVVETAMKTRVRSIAALKSKVP